MVRMGTGIGKNGDRHRLDDPSCLQPKKGRGIVSAIRVACNLVLACPHFCLGLSPFLPLHFTLHPSHFPLLRPSPRSGARGARYSSLRELRNSATMRQTTFGVSPDLDDVIGLGWATYFGEASLTLAVGPPIGRPIRYRGHADRHATARSFEMLGRELVAAASQQSRQSQIVRRSVLGQSAAF